MRACRDFAYEPSNRSSRKKTSIEWREKYAMKPMRHTIPSTRNIADAAAVHTLSIRCIRSSARDAAKCIIFPLQIGKQNDVALTLSHQKCFLRAHQSNRMLVHIAQDVLILQNKISFGSQQLQNSTDVSFWLLPFTLFIIRAHSWPFSFDSRFECRMILLCYKMLHRAASILQGIWLRFNSVYSFHFFFFWMQLRSNNVNSIFQFSFDRNSSTRLVYSNMNASI